MQMPIDELREAVYKMDEIRLATKDQAVERVTSWIDYRKRCHPEHCQFADLMIYAYSRRAAHIALRGEKELLPTDILTITGKRWFQKTYGNTYHTVKVWLNSTLIVDAPMRYGYGEQYLQTAHEELNKLGYFGPDYWDFEGWRREHRQQCLINVYDVDRKRDL